MGKVKTGRLPGSPRFKDSLTYSISFFEIGIFPQIHRYI